MDRKDRLYTDVLQKTKLLLKLPKSDIEKKIYPVVSDIYSYQFKTPNPDCKG